MPPPTGPCPARIQWVRARTEPKVVANDAHATMADRSPGPMSWTQALRRCVDRERARVAALRVTPTGYGYGDGLDP